MKSQFGNGTCKDYNNAPLPSPPTWQLGTHVMGDLTDFFSSLSAGGVTYYSPGTHITTPSVRFSQSPTPEDSCCGFEGRVSPTTSAANPPDPEPARPRAPVAGTFHMRPHTTLYMGILLLSAVEYKNEPRVLPVQMPETYALARTEGARRN
jgi:hypothetical protein